MDAARKPAVSKSRGGRGILRAPRSSVEAARPGVCGPGRRLFLRVVSGFSGKVPRQRSAGPSRLLQARTLRADLPPPAGIAGTRRASVPEKLFSSADRREDCKTSAPENVVAAADRRAAGVDRHIARAVAEFIHARGTAAFRHHPRDFRTGREISMTSLVEQYPLLWLAGIGLLGVLIIVAMLFTLWRVEKYPEAAPKAPAEAVPESAQAAAPLNDAAAPPPRLSAGESQRQVEASMKSGARYLRENASQRGSGYETPWFFAVGAPESGKSALLENSDIPFSLHDGAADFSVSHGIRWNFFRGGVVLDVPGRLFAPSGESGAD